MRWEVPAGGCVLGDGPMGTSLHSFGLPPGRASDPWNLERPERVEAVHRAFVEAGARWLVTNTFGATEPRLRREGLERRAGAVNRAAVAAARAAAGDRPVIASVGPTGAPAAEWERAYAAQVEALAAAGVEGFLVETIVAVDEGTAAVRAAAAAGLGVVIASFTPSVEGALLDGTPLPRAAETWLRAGATLLGVNCGAGPESLVAPVDVLIRLGAAPVLARPSAGLPERRGSGLWYPVRPDAFAAAAIQFQDTGVRMFGGCCGVTPEHLAAAAVALAST